jgi:hypothetical protein
MTGLTFCCRHGRKRRNQKEYERQAELRKKIETA